jgi:hypothetical protein
MHTCITSHLCIFIPNNASSSLKEQFLESATYTGEPLTPFKRHHCNAYSPSFPFTKFIVRVALIYCPKKCSCTLNTLGIDRYPVSLPAPIPSSFNPLIRQFVSLGKVESALPVTSSHTEPLPQNAHIAVIRHLEVVDARHDGREVVVGCVRRFAGFAYDGEHGCESLETCFVC